MATPDNQRIQAALESLDYRVADGNLDRTIRRFQRDHSLAVDGIVGRKTSAALRQAAGDPQRLRRDDIEAAAERLGCTTAAIRAVIAVETTGSGFWGTKPVILFERHIFWRRLKAAGIDPADHHSGNENILSRRSGGYAGGMAEYDRLRAAMRIHDPCALESASWGLFQVMGFHWQSLGWESIDAFVKDMYRDERAHLDAFVRYLGANNLTRALQDTDWPAFARGYNGPGYRRNKYDERLAKAYARFSKDVI